MSKIGDEDTIKTLKKFRESIDGLITVYEKDKSEVTEEEVEIATVKFMAAIIAMDGLK